jgi:hypothetical protein
LESGRDASEYGERVRARPRGGDRVDIMTIAFDVKCRVENARGLEVHFSGDCWEFYRVISHHVSGTKTRLANFAG